MSEPSIFELIGNALDLQQKLNSRTISVGIQIPTPPIVDKLRQENSELKQRIKELEKKND